MSIKTIKSGRHKLKFSLKKKIKNINKKIIIKKIKKKKEGDARSVSEGLVFVLALVWHGQRAIISKLYVLEVLLVLSFKKPNPVKKFCKINKNLTYAIIVSFGQKVKYP